MFYKVMLQQEAPRIGCGMRFVFLHKLGRKYAYIRCASKFTPARLHVRVWNQIVVEPVEIKPSSIKKRIKRYRSYGYKVTKAIKELAAN